MRVCIKYCREVASAFKIFLASRWTDEEFGRYNCLEGEIFQQGRVLGEFFKRLFGGRRGLRNGFLDQIVSNAKANVDVSLSGARLVASALTDFNSVMDKKSRGEPQDAKVDLIVKIEDVTIKVIKNCKILKGTSINFRVGRGSKKGPKYQTFRVKIVRHCIGRSKMAEKLRMSLMDIP